MKKQKTSKKGNEKVAAILANMQYTDTGVAIPRAYQKDIYKDILRNNFGVIPKSKFKKL